MPNKYEPNEEELKLIMSYYAESGTYAEVARRVGLSTFIVKRIIDENNKMRANRLISALTYDGPIPTEPSVKDYRDFKEKVEEFYKEVGTNGGLL